MNIPKDLRYTKDHEWLRVDGKNGVIGITDYAQGELGDIIYVDIPPANEIKQGDSFGTIEAVKTVSELFAPVSGKITEINSAINNNPASVNQDPYGEGWIVKVEIKDMKELDGLLAAEEYSKLVQGS